MNSYVKIVLTVIAISLSVIAFEGIVNVTSAVLAQPGPQRVKICDSQGNCAGMVHCDLLLRSDSRPSRHEPVGRHICYPNGSDSGDADFFDFSSVRVARALLMPRSALVYAS